MSKPVKKSKRTKDRVTTESLLLTAAKSVFSEHGYDGSTTRMIAKAAGVNPALIARYFAGKHGLFIAMIRDSAVTRSVGPLGYPPQATLVEELCQYAEHYLSTIYKSPELLRIVVVQGITDPEFAKEMRQTDFKTWETEISSRISMLCGELKVTPSEKEVHDIISAVDRIVLGSAILQYMIAGTSEKQCRLEVRTAIETFARLQVAFAQEITGSLTS